MQNRTVINSLLFKTVERCSVKAIGLVIGIILARLLDPALYGQLAIIMVFINLSQVFVQSGLNMALVQRNDVTDVDYSTVFYISLLMSFVLIGVLWITAPYIACYYEQEALVQPLRVYAFSLIAAAFNSVQVAKGQKAMKFRQMMWCNVAASVAAGVLGIVLAYLHAGIWALIAYYMSTTVFALLTMMLTIKWRPQRMFSISRAKVLFGFGWKILISALLCSLYSDIRNLIVGKKFSTTDLAYYSKGEQFPQLIATSIDSSIQSVMFPVFASVQDDFERIKRYMRQCCSIGSFVIVPVMFGLAAVSEPVISILLTEKWLSCVPYMEVLCFSSALIPLLTSNLIVIKAMGRSDIYMRLEIVRRIMMVCILAISVFCFQTVYAITVGCLISNIIDVMIVSVPVKKLLGYGFLEQCKNTWKTFLSAFLMWGIVMLLGRVSIGSIYICLLVQIFVGAICYLILSLLLKNEVIVWVKDMLLKKRKQTEE